jgi:hypothetical protein
VASFVGLGFTKDAGQQGLHPREADTDRIDVGREQLLLRPVQPAQCDFGKMIQKLLVILLPF